MVKIIGAIKAIWEDYQKKKAFKKWLADGLKRLKESPDLWDE